MALYKPVKQDDGVVTNYHRICFMQYHINSHISIVVFSYVDRVARDTENSEVQPYVKSVTYEKDYHENMTVEEAYEYLRSLPQFAGADDI